MAKLSKTQTAGNLHPRENLFIAGNLASNGAALVLDCDGCSTVALDLRQTFSETVEVAGTIDDINWQVISMRPLNQASVSYVAAITGTAQGSWVGECAGFAKVRARVTAYTSGSAAAVLVASTAVIADQLKNLCTPLLVTNTGAAGAAVTLTLPAPGAGLRQYLTYLSINRFATALLTAAATPVLVTTTNLPGTLVFSRPAEAAAQGTIDTYREDFAYPLAASAQNTAVTVVAPITTGVLWRLTGGYFVAP